MLTNSLSPIKQSFHKANSQSDISSHLLSDQLCSVNESGQHRKEANCLDSMETEVMKALVTLPPLCAIQSHSLSQDILQLFNYQSLTARLLKSLSLLPISSFSYFLSCYKVRRWNRRRMFTNPRWSLWVLLWVKTESRPLDWGAKVPLQREPKP